MMKKLLLIVVTLFATVQAQDCYEDDCNPAFQELVFDIGMSLADQNTIVDVSTMKHAIANVYQEVDQVAQIIDMYMIIDEDIAEQNITSIDALIDYELHNDELLAQATVKWLSAYQDLFIVFIAIHQEDSSFEAWSDDMAFLASLADGEQPEDSEYAMLWFVSCLFYEAQADFENALKSAE